MLHLEPTPHSVADNIWHTLLITAVSALGLWFGWLTLLTDLEAGQMLSGMEVRLAAGEVGGLYGWVESLTDPLTALRWNRAVSGLGWLLTLFMVGRILTRLSGFLSALPACLVLTNLPGLTSYMVSGGSGSVGAFLFLIAFSAVLLEDDTPKWVKGGIAASVAVLLQPMWLLPLIGLLIACFEVNRPACIRAGIGFGGGLLVFTGLAAILLPGGIGWPVAAPDVVPHEISLGGFFSPAFLLMQASLIVLIGYGALKRGMGWWALVLALPGLWIGEKLAADPWAGWFPVLLLICLGLVKVPRLLDVRHPRAYQSVLLCQLLLWIPLHLERLPKAEVEEDEAAPAVEAAEVTEEAGAEDVEGM